MIATRDRSVVLLLGASPAHEAEVRSAVAARVDLVAEHAIPGALSALEAVRPCAALVDLGESGEVSAIEALHRASPALPIVALADRKDPDLILCAIRAGAREFVVKGEAGELPRVLFPLIERSAAVSRGTIIGVTSSKGGSGASMVATNVAAELAADPARRVVLVDLDLRLGDVLASLDLECRNGISDLYAQMARFDRDLLLAALPRHACGLHVLAQTDRFEEADRVSPADIPVLLGFLAEHFDFVVIDGVRGLDEMALSALDVCARVLMVLAQDVLSMKNAHRCSDVFRRLGYPEGKIAVVVNRYDKSSPIELASVSENLEREIFAVLANDYRATRSAVDRGVPVSEVAPRSKLTEDLRGLAMRLQGRQQQPAKKGGFLSGLFTGKGARDGTRRTVETIR